MRDILANPATSSVHINRNIYYVLVCLFLVLLASIRSAPIYGKLDFLLVENKPWWPEWKPAIEEVLSQGEQIILTDPITGTVFRGVFMQKTNYFRKFFPQRIVNIADLNRKNRSFSSISSMLPYYIYPLLLNESSAWNTTDGENVPQRNWAILESISPVQDENIKKTSKHPYRCLINLHGFQDSWVARETKHWVPVLGNTALWYHFDGIRGRAMRQLIKDQPPENCTIFL